MIFTSRFTLQVSKTCFDNNGDKTMDKLMIDIKNFFNDEEGLTVVEYVIGAAMLVFGLTTIFSGIGTVLANKLSAIIGAISTTSAP
jgi:pilus assembly protein Flp/PilA